MGLLDKLLGKNTKIEINKDADASTVIAESAPPASTQTSSKPKPKKPRKPRVKKVVEEPKKIEESKKEEPRVNVIGFDFDPQNPSMGSMELDWNAEFIEMLRANNYRGINPEDLVDAWLNDVARNIINSNAQNPPNMDGSNRYVTRTDLGNGKTEFK